MALTKALEAAPAKTSMGERCRNCLTCDHRSSSPVLGTCSCPICVSGDQSVISWHRIWNHVVLAEPQRSSAVVASAAGVVIAAAVWRWSASRSSTPPQQSHSGLAWLARGATVVSAAALAMSALSLWHKASRSRHRRDQRRNTAAVLDTVSYDSSLTDSVTAISTGAVSAACITETEDKTSRLYRPPGLLDSQPMQSQQPLLHSGSVAHAQSRDASAAGVHIEQSQSDAAANTRNGGADAQAAVSLRQKEMQVVIKLKDIRVRMPASASVSTQGKRTCAPISLCLTAQCVQYSRCRLLTSVTPDPMSQMGMSAAARGGRGRVLCVVTCFGRSYIAAVLEVLIDSNQCPVRTCQIR